MKYTIAMRKYESGREEYDVIFDGGDIFGIARHYSLGQFPTEAEARAYIADRKVVERRDIKL